MSKPNYKSIQTRLVELDAKPGPGPIDGLNGRKTKAAVRAFQTQEGLVADGKVGPITHAALHKGLSPKRIVVFCDGTWNSPYSVQTTHVYQLSEATQESEEQIKAYFKGVGTGGKLKTFVGKLANKIGGGAFGWGLDAKIREAYAFIAKNYKPCDEILIFGFSRGAFTARSLAGMIRKCGIIEDAHDEKKVKDAFSFYRTGGAENAPDEKHIRDQRAVMSPQFATSMFELAERESPAYMVRVSYLGIWDTVGALGIPEPVFGLIAKFSNKRFQFHDTVLSRMTQSARHAVAIDERRNIYEPALWSNLDNTSERAGLNGSQTNANRPFQQLWFAGDHSIVGGSGQNKPLTSVTLKWIADGAVAQGLKLKRMNRFPDPAPDPVNFIKGEVLHRSGDGGLKAWRSGPKSGAELSEAARQRVKTIDSYEPENLRRWLKKYFS